MKAEALESHDDGSNNFDCQLLTGDHTNFIDTSDIVKYSLDNGKKVIQILPSTLAVTYL